MGVLKTTERVGNNFIEVKMKNIFFALGAFVLVLGGVSCTKKDCHCTYLDEKGVEVPSYTADYEDMTVDECSSLSTRAENDTIRGFICK